MTEEKKQHSRRRKVDQKMKPYLVYDYLMRNTDGTHKLNAEAIVKRKFFSMHCKAPQALYVEMIGLIGAGNTPRLGMTAHARVAIEEASK